MPFIPNTPESFLTRSDSKNPYTTCKGITSTGRACRRSLATLVQRKRDDLETSTVPSNVFGTVRITHHHNASTLRTRDEAVFYCWQHKDQANVLDDRISETRTELFDLKSRSSLDSLVKRFGLLDLKAAVSTAPKKSSIAVQSKAQGAGSKKERDHPQTGVVKSPDKGAFPRGRPRPRRRSRGLRFSCFFCVFESGHDDGNRLANQPRSSPAIQPQMSTVKTQSTQPLIKRTPSRNFPENAGADLEAHLLAESNRLASVNDEPGYIYIFVLSKDNVAHATTTPRLQPHTVLPSDDAPLQLPRTSDILSHQQGGKLLLKIGRASNVQRRMNEWTRQCGYTLQVMRFYPRDCRSMSKRSVLSEPQPAPYIKAVERLVHMELSQDRAAWKCSRCGKLHREWFEIEASKEAVKRVDEVIQRWISWAREQSLKLSPTRLTPAGYF